MLRVLNFCVRAFPSLQQSIKLCPVTMFQAKSLIRRCTKLLKLPVPLYQSKQSSLMTFNPTTGFMDITMPTCRIPCLIKPNWLPISSAMFKFQGIICIGMQLILSFAVDRFLKCRIPAYRFE